jgi:hypothetical protein
LLAGCAAPPVASPSAPPPGGPRPFVIDAPDWSCQITIDTSKADDLKDWAETTLAPVLADWYPKISALLPSPGYAPPNKWSVSIAPGDGVAATSGTRVTANATWFRGELDKQAVGALLHEEVHVVQQYGASRRNNPPGTFSIGDVTNLASLSIKIKDKADSVSAFLEGQLTPSERKALAAYHGPGHKAYLWRTNLAGVLNRVVRGPALYDAALFKSVSLRESTAALRDGSPSGGDLARLNRALLEDAYPEELAHRGGNGGRNRGGTGWLTEGIADYIRWFIFEPQSHGADTAYLQRRFESDAKKGQVYVPKYNDSYRVTANFLDFVARKYDRHIIRKLNDALRQGKYYDDLWLDDLGKTAQQLNDEWAAAVRQEIKNLKPAPAA